jgi:hypothetical protein
MIQTFFVSTGLITVKIKAMPSTVIKHFSYDSGTSTLTITFVSGNVYNYKDVPQKVYRSLKIAGSKGSYFNRFIKNRFEFEQLQI